VNEIRIIDLQDIKSVTSHNALLLIRWNYFTYTGQHGARWIGESTIGKISDENLLAETSS
ncbi:MAG: hypothetical protein K2X28_06255, partial [Alphaproteobacteria bacterium]|nr:hypothetical protein [Alphaproteobacteria bacterium]